MQTHLISGDGLRIDDGLLFSLFFFNEISCNNYLFILSSSSFIMPPSSCFFAKCASFPNGKYYFFI